MNDPDPMMARMSALRARLAEGPVVDPEADDTDRRLDFMAWWLRAARLAALGDRDIFGAWPAHAARLGVDVVLAFREAARDGIELLDDSSGELLAEAVVDAEDAVCLAHAESTITGLLVDDLSMISDAWSLAAERVIVDDVAMSILLDHRDAWRLPEELRLSVIETPLGETEFLLAAAGGTPSNVVRLSKIFEYEPLAAQFHAGERTPEAMRARFEERRGEAVTPAGDLLQVNPRLDAYWGVFVELVGEAARRVRSVRLGTWPLRAVSEVDDEDQPMRLFELSLSGQPLDVRLRLVSSDIGVTTDDGGRYLL